MRPRDGRRSHGLTVAVLRKALRPQVFRTRAVVYSGLADLALGLVVLAGGIALAAFDAARTAVPIGLGAIVLGVTIALTGLGRALSRLEIHPTTVVWTWWFSRHEVALADLEMAALVEPGSPTSGGEWAAFLPGGLLAVVAWWLYGLVVSVVRAEPTLGSHALFLVRRYGPPERVEPIGSFAFSTKGTTAAAAQQAIQLAIDRCHIHSTPADEVESPPRLPRFMT